MVEISFGKNTNSQKSPPHLGGNGEHFTYFLQIPNNQGDVIAAVTTSASCQGGLLSRNDQRYRIT
jgi:hypothetical protein